jgi:hypothetical protein
MTSFADDRRLIELAGSLESLEAAAKRLGRKPKSVAKSARRLGLPLKRASPAERAKNERATIALDFHDRGVPKARSGLHIAPISKK